MNTPNKLTVARMILVPFLVLFMLTDLGGEANRYIALAIFVVASVTDWFDGKLAIQSGDKLWKIHGSSCRQAACVFCNDLLY